MSKRFTDTEKWNKKFIRSLKVENKLLWFYITDECNTAGIWEVDIDVAELKIGVKLNVQSAIKDLGNKIHVIDNGNKWFIPSFIEFQYGELSEGNRAHSKAIATLKRYNLISDDLKIKPLTSPLQAPIQGAMVEEEDMVEVEEEEKGAFFNFQKFISENAPRVAKMKEPFTEREFNALMDDFSQQQISDVLMSMHNHADLLKKNVSANQTLRNWAKRRGFEKAQPNSQPPQYPHL